MEIDEGRQERQPSVTNMTGCCPRTARMLRTGNAIELVPTYWRRVAEFDQAPAKRRGGRVV
jgi:hypothetical protein